jgi:hypothetical protein
MFYSTYGIYEHYCLLFPQHIVINKTGNVRTFNATLRRVHETIVAV